MRSKVIDFFRKIYRDRFKRYLTISLIILGIVLIVTGQEAAKPPADEGFVVHFFYLPACSACAEQKPFNERLAAQYPSISVREHDVSSSRRHSLMLEMLADLGIDEEPFVPVTIFGNQAFLDWKSEETTGRAIEEALQQCLAGDCPTPVREEPRSELTLPIIGEIVPAEYSLPALAVVLGLVDGFNPCALWVLIYLISLTASLKDRRRIWLIVGSFVMASGVLYFLFMTAWLNAFLFIGYVRPVTVVIGLVALGGGTMQIRDFIATKGAIVCEVTGQESREKTMDRVQKIASSPITLGTIAGIIVLAFVVNSIEFVCSAAIPAIFTHVLALSHLSTFQYYGYILLYVFFFMLDQLIIFGSAAFAMTSSLGERYAKYARPVGATILIILGALLLFAPGLLR